jgi:alginate O-acetyltransferase complex protein AlgI
MVLGLPPRIRALDLISLPFALFLGLALALTRLPLGERPRRAVLLAFNLAFLGSFDPLAPLFFLATSLLAWFAARQGQRGAPAALFYGLLLPLLLPLFVPKLGLFGAAGEADAAGNVLGSRLALFVGASYFTLRALHFAIDARRRRQLSLSLFDYLTWNSFFPTLTAGPIERAEHLGQSLVRLGRADAQDLSAGLARIYVGLLKKVVLGQLLVAWAGPITGFAPGQELGFTEAWGALYAMCLFAYVDFAGYSDLAIGMARLFGLRLAENFDNPYLRGNISDFWKGWHISLSTWIRDYLFLPLCGRSQSTLRPHLAALLSMSLCGLWHAPTLAWLCWGLAHGAGLSAHQAWMQFLRKRFKLKKRLAKSWPYRLLATWVTFHFVALTWVLISVPGGDLRAALAYFVELFGG